MVLQQYSVFGRITKAKSDSFDTEGICNYLIISYIRYCMLGQFRACK